MLPTCGAPAAPIRGTSPLGRTTDVRHSPRLSRASAPPLQPRPQGEPPALPTPPSATDVQQSPGERQAAAATLWQPPGAEPHAPLAPRPSRPPHATEVQHVPRKRQAAAAPLWHPPGAEPHAPLAAHTSRPSHATEVQHAPHRRRVSAGFPQPRPAREVPARPNRGTPRPARAAAAPPPPPGPHAPARPPAPSPADEPPPLPTSGTSTFSPPTGLRCHLCSSWRIRRPSPHAGVPRWTPQTMRGRVPQHDKPTPPPNSEWPLAGFCLWLGGRRCRRRYVRRALREPFRQTASSHPVGRLLPPAQAQARPRRPETRADLRPRAWPGAAGRPRPAPGPSRGTHRPPRAPCARPPTRRPGPSPLLRAPPRPRSASGPRRANAQAHPRWRARERPPRSASRPRLGSDAASHAPLPRARRWPRTQGRGAPRARAARARP
mmetsp:Transcript_51617/g.165985  ORF Transcript_51617/g.165985 Transcript_51617/m.165985 type:complete len:434 (+) Transcript_51617:989-2290(+)